MKSLKLLSVVFCCLLYSCSHKQDPKAVEDDLFKSFKKICYRRKTDFYDTSGRYNIDSLSAANDTFEKKLKFYTSEYPFTMSYRFKSIDTLGLGSIASADGLFKIYFWDTGMGGTQLDYDNVFQYKSGVKTYSVSAGDSLGKLASYDTIYTLTKNNKTYYLAVYNVKMDFYDFTSGIRVFSIENGILKDNVKIIKTKSGFYSQLQYDYVYHPGVDDNLEDDWFDIHYDEKSATLKIPVILENGSATGNYINYKFTGQYFERIKN